jgi:protein TonB
MKVLAKPSPAAKGAVTGSRFEAWPESPARGYFISALLAMGIHAGLIFGWQRSPHFEPAEYGVVNGESAIEVALIATPPAVQEMQGPVEAQEAIATQEPVTTQETKQETIAEIAEEPDPEPVPSPAELPVFNMAQEMPKPESTPKARPVPARTAAISASAEARPVAARKGRATASPGTGGSGENSLAFNATLGSRTSKPAYLYNPHPPYPEPARSAGQTGVVMLRVSINERGRVNAVSLIRSSGHSRLDHSARTAVQRWIFRPARLNGKPVATQVDVPVRFSLDRR